MMPMATRCSITVVESTQKFSNSDGITVVARSRDAAGVARISNGQRVQASGIVTRIEYMSLQACTITLSNATFS